VRTKLTISSSVQLWSRRVQSSFAFASTSLSESSITPPDSHVNVTLWSHPYLMPSSAQCKATRADIDLAIRNGVSCSTVYRRLHAGWTKEEAVSTPTRRTDTAKQKRSKLYGMKRGRSRRYRLPKDWEDTFAIAVAESGRNESDWVAEAIGFRLGLVD
jgi:hypothetical protein